MLRTSFVSRSTLGLLGLTLCTSAGRAQGPAPTPRQQLAREAGLTVGELSRVLMQLELKRLIRRLPGNSYERR